MPRTDIYLSEEIETTLNEMAKDSFRTRENLIESVLFLVCDSYTKDLLVVSLNRLGLPYKFEREAKAEVKAAEHNEVATTPKCTGNCGLSYCDENGCVENKGSSVTMPVNPFDKPIDNAYKKRHRKTK